LFFRQLSVGNSSVEGSTLLIWVKLQERCQNFCLGRK